MPMPKLTVVVRDYDWRPWVLTDVVDSGVQFSTTENGFDTLFLPLKRPPDDYLELGFNMHIMLKTPNYDSVFEGVLDTQNIAYEAATGKIGWNCYGYWYATNDTLFSQTSVTVTPEAFIKTYVMTRTVGGGSTSPMTYLPRLLYDTSQIYTTGRGAIPFATPDSGRSKIRAQAAILQACLAGDSSNQKVIPFVWEDRILGTKPLAVNSTAKYVVDSLKYVRLNEKESMSDIYNRINVKYTDSGTGLVSYTAPTYVFTWPLLPYWTTDYPDDVLDATTGRSVTNVYRDKEVDITSKGAMTATSAAYYGNPYFADAITLRPIGGITLLPECRVWDAGEGCYRQPYELRAGEFIQFPKTLVRPSVGWGMFYGNEKRLIYMSRTDCRNGEVVITPARATDIMKNV